MVPPAAASWWKEWANFKILGRDLHVSYQSSVLSSAMYQEVLLFGIFHIKKHYFIKKNLQFSIEK